MQVIRCDRCGKIIDADRAYKFTCYVPGQDIAFTDALREVDFCVECAVKVVNEITGKKEEPETDAPTPTEPDSQSDTPSMPSTGSQNSSLTELAEELAGKRKRTPIDWTEADKLHAKGVSNADIAKATGINYKVVYSHYIYGKGGKK